MKPVAISGVMPLAARSFRVASAGAAATGAGGGGVANSDCISADAAEGSGAAAAADGANAGNDGGSTADDDAVSGYAPLVARCSTAVKTSLDSTRRSNRLRVTCRYDAKMVLNMKTLVPWGEKTPRSVPHPPHGDVSVWRQKKM